MIDTRQWGMMWKIWHGKKFWIKIIWVKEGEMTSKQFHWDRTEYHLSFWNYNKIKPEERHRLEAGLYLEIATGDPKEDDIERLEDKYGRV